MATTELPHVLPSSAWTPVEDVDEAATLATSPMPDARVTFAELAASFYLWLLAWLVVWTVVPAVTLGWEPVLIVSGSMGPVITAGDMVLIGDPPDAAALEPGTVITFTSPDDPSVLITHRIEGVRPDGRYQTRGDANVEADSAPVSHDQVVGVGRMMVPLIGLPLLWLSNDLVTFGIFVLATVGAAATANAARTQARTTIEAHLSYLADAPQPDEGFDLTGTKQSVTQAQSAGDAAEVDEGTDR